MAPDGARQRRRRWAPTRSTLHVDNGPLSEMDPATGATWGALSEQDSLSHQDVLGSFAGSSYDWSAFQTLKSANFESERAPVFHYAISAHGFSGTVSGNARGIPSSDLLVTLGAGCLANQGSDRTFSDKEQAGSFMHELGHNIGLHHGGDDDVKHKPSYLSVMNYAERRARRWFHGRRRGGRELVPLHRPPRRPQAAPGPLPARRGAGRE